MTTALIEYDPEDVEFFVLITRDHESVMLSFSPSDLHQLKTLFSWLNIKEVQLGRSIKEEQKYIINWALRKQ